MVKKLNIDFLRKVYVMNSVDKKITRKIIDKATNTIVLISMSFCLTFHIE